MTLEEKIVNGIELNRYEACDAFYDFSRNGSCKNLEVRK